MYTRREFLRSAAVVGVAPQLLNSAIAQQPAPESEVFADFESGTFDGWTLTGNCWTKEPHTGNTIEGITGFQGRRFLCSLHPRLGHNVTGKAVSREFTIEKPYITFLIGGGNHPGKACLNLVVDGKVVRTETGNDSAEIRPATWGAGELIGKRAHFEVVDMVAVGPRGYVMVDSIEFSDRPIDQRTLHYESGPLLASYGLKHPFFDNCSQRFSTVSGEVELGPVFDFGITPRTHKALIEETCSQVYRLKHDPSRPMAETALLLCKIADEQREQFGAQGSLPLLKQWMRAEAICAFVIANVRYDFGLLERTIGEGPERGMERWRLQRPEVVYSSAKPLATCDGYSRLTERLAELSGLAVKGINGTLRSWAIKGEAPNHGWVVFEFDQGICVPADTTLGTSWKNVPSLAGAKRRFRDSIVLPRTIRGWEAYLSGHFENNVGVGEGPAGGMRIAPAGKYRLTRLTFEEWRAFQALPIWDGYSKLLMWYQRQDDAYIQRYAQ